MCECSACILTYLKDMEGVVVTSLGLLVGRNGLHGLLIGGGVTYIKKPCPIIDLHT